jgi:hypothetical protein
MGHEQTRRDRDEWISWNTNMCEPEGLDAEDFGRGLHKFYDYLSIQHSEGEASVVQNANHANMCYVSCVALI